MTNLVPRTSNWDAAGRRSGTNATLDGRRTSNRGGNDRCSGQGVSAENDRITPFVGLPNAGDPYLAEDAATARIDRQHLLSLVGDELHDVLRDALEEGLALDATPRTTTLPLGVQARVIDSTPSLPALALPEPELELEPIAPTLARRTAKGAGTAILALAALAVLVLVATQPERTSRLTPRTAARTVVATNTELATTLVRRRATTAPIVVAPPVVPQVAVAPPLVAPVAPPPESTRAGGIIRSVPF